MHPSLVDTIERYMRQQQMMYGSTLYFQIPNEAELLHHNDEESYTQPQELHPSEHGDLHHSHPAVPLAQEKSTDSVLLMPQTSPDRSITTQDHQHKAGDSLEKHLTVVQPSLSSSMQHREPLSTPALWQTATTLDTLNEQICSCLQCPLGATRTNFVFGTGNPRATLMVIGEAPGADEDAQGMPFVGRGGQLLTKMLEAVQFARDDVFIANIIKCRPPGNRRPTAHEVEQCEPYLHKQIALIQPKIILAVGLTAVNTLMKNDYKMGDIRGKKLLYRSIPLVATYHPAALLRNPEWKKPAYEDLQLLRKLHDTLVH